MVELQPLPFYISFDKKLRDIHPPQNPCGFCGGEEQRELQDFETRTNIGRKITVTAVPTYGCTDCGMKGYTEDIAARVLGKAAIKVWREGVKEERQDARRLIKEARSLKNSGSQR